MTTGIEINFLSNQWIQTMQNDGCHPLHAQTAQCWAQPGSRSHRAGSHVMRISSESSVHRRGCTIPSLGSLCTQPVNVHLYVDAQY